MVWFTVMNVQTLKIKGFMEDLCLITWLSMHFAFGNILFYVVLDKHTN